MRLRQDHAHFRRVRGRQGKVGRLQLLLVDDEAELGRGQDDAQLGLRRLEHQVGRRGLGRGDDGREVGLGELSFFF